jgi:phage I-like protein
MYGMPVDQLMKQIEEAQLEENAKSQGIPVEVLRRQQETQNQVKAQDEQIAQLKFQLWDSRMKVEEQALKDTYSMLTDQDLLDARMHLLESGQADAPLDRAVRYLHSDKIMKAEIEKAKQEWLAEQSGRKKSPVAIQGGKPKQTGSLTADEKYVAKMMGISEEDYLKYK